MKHEHRGSENIFLRLSGDLFAAIAWVLVIYHILRLPITIFYFLAWVWRCSIVAAGRLLSMVCALILKHCCGEKDVEIVDERFQGWPELRDEKIRNPSGNWFGYGLLTFFLCMIFIVLWFYNGWFSSFYQ